MEKNDIIKERLDAFRPDLGDKAAYMAGLENKLKSAEVLYRICEEKAVESRKAIAVTFVSGIIIGALLAAFIILDPISLPDFSFKLGTYVIISTLDKLSVIAASLIAATVLFLIARSQVKSAE